MAPQTSSHSPQPERDDLDDLFDYEPNIDDIFRDKDAGANRSTTAQKQGNSANHQDTAGGLGIDEEIKIVKKRQLIAKLDDNRLLSDLGIPKLRKIAKKRKNFRGKGHEFSDVSKLLAMYQLWLDELYPRAKFADGLAIIEKLGHSKRMQMMRKQWIDEGKPRHTVDEEEEGVSTEVTEIGDNTANSTNNAQQDTDDGHAESANADTRPPLEQAREDVEIEPDEDELDALMAEDTQVTSDKPTPAEPAKPAATNPIATERTNFEDDEEAMADFGDMW